MLIVVCHYDFGVFITQQKLTNTQFLFAPLPKSPLWNLWNIDLSCYWYTMSDSSCRIKFQTFILRCKPCLAQLQLLIPISLYHKPDSFAIQNTWRSEAYFWLWLLHTFIFPFLLSALSSHTCFVFSYLFFKTSSNATTLWDLETYWRPHGTS